MFLCKKVPISSHIASFHKNADKICHSSQWLFKDSEQFARLKSTTISASKELSSFIPDKDPSEQSSKQIKRLKKIFKKLQMQCDNYGGALNLTPCLIEKEKRKYRAKKIWIDSFFILAFLNQLSIMDNSIEEDSYNNNAPETLQNLDEYLIYNHKLIFFKVRKTVENYFKKLFINNKFGSVQTREITKKQ